MFLFFNFLVLHCRYTMNRHQHLVGAAKRMSRTCAPKNDSSTAPAPLRILNHKP